jgi:hypothetical protein
MLALENSNDPGQTNKELDQLDRDAMCSPRARLTHAIRFDKQASQHYFVDAYNVVGETVTDFTKHFVDLVVERSVVTVSETVHGELTDIPIHIPVTTRHHSKLLDLKKDLEKLHMGRSLSAYGSTISSEIDLV